MSHSRLLWLRVFTGDETQVLSPIPTNPTSGTGCDPSTTMVLPPVEKKRCHAVGEHHSARYLEPFLKTSIRIYSHLPCGAAKGVPGGQPETERGDWTGTSESIQTSTRTKQPQVGLGVIWPDLFEGNHKLCITYGILKLLFFPNSA